MTTPASQANETRLIANEIMRQLYLCGEVEQLKILVAYGQLCLEQIEQERRP